MTKTAFSLRICRTSLLGFTQAPALPLKLCRHTLQLLLFRGKQDIKPMNMLHKKGKAQESNAEHDVIVSNYVKNVTESKEKTTSDKKITEIDR